MKTTQFLNFKNWLRFKYIFKEKEGFSFMKVRNSFFRFFLIEAQVSEMLLNIFFNFIILNFFKNQIKKPNYKSKISKSRYQISKNSNSKKFLNHDVIQKPCQIGSFSFISPFFLDCIPCSK